MTPLIERFIKYVKFETTSDENTGVTPSTPTQMVFAKELKKPYLSRMPVKGTGCQYCQPCPQDVRIPEIFEAYNNARMFDQPARFFQHYAHLEKQQKGASGCVQCGACEAACPQHLPIIEWLQRIRREADAPRP